MDVSKFRGDPLELKWNRKGLAALETVLPLVQNRRSCVQAGGCLGVFAKRLSQEFQSVYVFEPSQQFVDMTANAPQPNIYRFQAALGCTRGMVRPVNSLDGYEGKVELHSGMTMMQPGGSVPIITLDDLELHHVDLIYLDVEGYEHRALRGAEYTIATCRPVVVVEVNRAIEIVGDSPDELRAWLRERGYRLHSRIHSDEVYVP